MSNTWQIEILESYLGKSAHYFEFDGEKAICSINKSESDDFESKFQIELIYCEDKSIRLYCQLINSYDENGEYILLKETNIANPDSNKEMKKAVEGLISSIDIDERTGE